MQTTEQRLQRLKEVCAFDDPVSFSGILYPVLMKGRFYECDTALHLWENDMRDPFTRAELSFDDIADAPQAVKDICRVLAEDEGVREDRKRLRRRYGKFLYIKGKFESAADYDYLRAIVELAEEECCTEDKWYQRLVAAHALHGAHFLGFAQLRDECGSRDAAHQTLALLWNNPAWTFKAQTAYLIAFNYYARDMNKHAARWCKRAMPLHCGKLLAAHICYRTNYSWKPAEKWDDIIMHLPLHSWVRADSPEPYLCTPFTHLDHAKDAVFLLELAKKKAGYYCDPFGLRILADYHEYAPARELLAGKKKITVTHRLPPYTSLFEWD